MQLPGTVVPASPGLIGFDTTSSVNSAQARTYASKGYRFCIRYVSRDDSGRQYNQQNGTPDFSYDDGTAILGAGMALMVVQHCPLPGWKPSAALGTTYGQNAASYASDGGLPAGVNVWLDLEGIAQGTAQDDIIGYCNAWFAAVKTGGYEPGVYIGFDVWLSPDQLYLNLRTSHYWRADGNIPDISHRGYQLIQHEQNGFDMNVTQNDDLNGATLWLASNAPLVA
jgi:hypothetical protein